MFKLYINKDSNDRIRVGDCESNVLGRDYCFDSEHVKDLEYITRFEVWEWDWIGDENKPVLHLFPNLRVLFLRPVPFLNKPINVTLVEFPFLRKFYIYLLHGGAVHLYCAFGSDRCLTNPQGLKTLEISVEHGHYVYSNSIPGFKLYGTWSLPKQIGSLKFSNELTGTDEYSVDAEDDNMGFSAVEVEEVEQKNTAVADASSHDSREIRPVFDRTEFGEVELHYNAITKAGLTLDDFKLPYIKDEIKIRANGQMDWMALSQKFWKMEIDSVLSTYTYGDVKDDERIGYLYLEKANFDKFQFSNCHYANTVLENSKVETILSHELMIVRGFHMKLSEAINTAREGEKFNEVKEVHIYAYSLDVDVNYEEVNEEVNDKNFTYFFLEIGTTTLEMTSLTRQFQKEFKPFGPFFHLSNSRNPDPIFLRALTTCFIVKMAETSESSPAEILAENEKLSYWYTVVQRLHRSSSAPKQDKELHARYSEMDISRTKSSFHYLQQYMYWRENVYSKVAQVPLLSLQVQSENMQILGDAGRDLLRRKEHLKTLASIDNMRSQVKQAQKETLSAIADSKIAILQAAKAKSDSLANIEKKR